MDQSEEAAFTVVENWWKKSFDISKNTNDPLFSLFTKSFETIMVYMSQSLDYEYILKEISSLDKDRQLALQSENGYDANRCLSFGLIEAVQMMMKKNTKKLEEMIKQGYIPVPDIPKFPLEPKEEEIMDVEPISTENEISSIPIPKEITEQPVDEFCHDFPDDQTSPLASIENFHPKEDEMMDDDVNTVMDHFAPQIENSLTGFPLNDEIMEEPNETLAEEVDPISHETIDNDEIIDDNNESSLNQTMNQGRKSTRRASRPVKYNSTNDSDEEEVEPIMKKSRPNSAKTSGEDSSHVKCVLCEIHPKTVRDYVNHLNERHKDKSTLIANGVYLICSCGEEVRSRRSFYKYHNECDGLGFTLHNKEDEVHSNPQCILCETYPKTVYGYTCHLDNKHKSTLHANEIYIVCSCGFKVRSADRGSKHSKECDGLQFTLHKTEADVHLSPQCILCETYPKTAHGYANHLKDVHKSTLKVNGSYLRCSCGLEVRSHFPNADHNKGCNGLRFTLHKFEDDIHTTPKCIICETYPKTAHGYAYHLSDKHKSTMNMNDRYILCSCGVKVRSAKRGTKHEKECDGLQFTLHKNIDE